MCARVECQCGMCLVYIVRTRCHLTNFLIVHVTLLSVDSTECTVEKLVPYPGQWILVLTDWTL